MKSRWLALVVFAVISISYQVAYGGNSALPPGDFISLEEKGRMAARGVNFLAPNFDIPELAVNWPIEETIKRDRARLVSSFIVLYKNRQFLLTASHVWSAQDTDPYNETVDVVVIGNKFFKIPPRSNRVFMTSVDLAAIEVTGHIPENVGGKLKSSINDLKEKSLLLVMCNPFRFATYFLGLHRKDSINGFLLTVGFPGDGAKPGCSGSPVVDENGFVRGLLTRILVEISGEVTVDEGYAVPAQHIIKFLDKSFFAK